MCANTSTGFTAITDLGSGTFKGEQGGLYPGGSNSPPGAYQSAGIQAGQAVVPRDGSGNPSASGKTVFLSIGMSNTSQEFDYFIRQEAGDSVRASSVLLVNGAQSGEDATKWLSPSDTTWAVVEQRLAQYGVTDRQVEVIWLKHADVVNVTRPDFETYGHTLQQQLAQITSIAASRYPNLQQVFVSARSYGGYGGIYPQTALASPNPEPWAYETAFADKWFVAQSVANPTQRPWVGWGPYFWTDGTRGRGDGLQWLCSDTVDGTHPSATGNAKVNSFLHSYFVSSAFSPWFTNSSPIPPSPTPAPTPTPVSTPRPAASPGASPGAGSGSHQPGATAGATAHPSATAGQATLPIPLRGLPGVISSPISAVAAMPPLERWSVVVVVTGAVMAAFAALILGRRWVLPSRRRRKPAMTGANGSPPLSAGPSEADKSAALVGSGTGSRDANDGGRPPAS